jgi:DNA-binding CsgD family transcriptional regulator
MTATRRDQLEAAASLANRMGLLKVPAGQAEYTLTRRDVQVLGRVVEAVHAALDEVDREAPPLWGERAGKPRRIDLKAEVRRRVLAALRVDERGPGWSRRRDRKEVALVADLPTRRRSDDPTHLLDRRDFGRELAALLDQYKVPPREREVLALLLRELPDAEVAKRLGITATTVRVTRAHLRARFAGLEKKIRPA